MIKPLYIRGIACISIQPTTEANYFFGHINQYAQNPIPAADPDYKTRIPALQLRRLGKSMKMSLFAAHSALADAGSPHIHAIITGTGLGCLKDSERFVESMIANNEQQLNPTPFIQSTHNMAAASIALSLGCKGYNMTYVNNANSFESAALDALLYLQEHEQESVLLGGVDELGETTTRFWDRVGYLKKDKTQVLPALTEALTNGEVAAEGAAVFVLSTQPGDKHYGQLTAIETRYELTDVPAFIESFITKQQLQLADIDVVILGNNGDASFDEVYHNLARTLFSNTAQVGYKHLFGEFDTSSSVALWLGAKILKEQHIPAVLRQNSIQEETISYLLIYQQRRGKNHSLFLLKK